MPIPDLIVVQAGSEASTDTWGESKVPTVKLMGITDFQFTPIVETQVFDDKRGSLAPGYDEVVTEVAGQASLEALATYEDLPYYMDGLFGIDTAIEDAGDTDYFDRAWKAPLAVYDSDTSAVPRYITFVQGDRESGVTSSDTFGMAGATLQSLSISGATGAPMTLSASYIGKQVVPDDLADLADRDVNPVMGDHLALYIDPSSDAAGTTLTSDVGFAFTLDINTNRALKRHFGSLTPSGYRDAKWQGTLALTLELGGESWPYLRAALASTPAAVKKTIRIKASSGFYVFQFDFTGVLTSAPVPFTDSDGVTTVELSFSGLYDSTQANWLDFEVTNLTETMA